GGVCRGAGDCGGARAGAHGVGQRHVILEGDAELDDAEQHDEQHGQDEDELHHRLTVVVTCADASLHRCPSPLGAGRFLGPPRADVIQEKTLVSCSKTLWIDPDSSPKLVTMASVMTARTTEYSAIVWASSRASVRILDVTFPPHFDRSWSAGVGALELADHAVQGAID